MVVIASSAGDVTIAAPDLERYLQAITAGLGASPAAAAAVAGSLVGANLAGHDSHGALLLPYWAELVDRGQIRVDTTPEVTLDRGAVVTLDGHLGFGPVAARMAVELARERARAHGVACVLARDVNHIGRLGEYTAALAASGQVALLLVNCQGSGQLIAPFGGIERRLTNNPISLAAPGETDPVLLDMALSVAAEAKVWLAKARGEEIPEEWVLDAQGRPSDNPDDLFAGGTLTALGGRAGGHKGYGLIVLVDVIAGILSGGGVCRPDPPSDFSNAFALFALDVDPLCERDRYRGELGTLRAHVTSATTMRPERPILFPGDAEATAQETRQRDGIDIEASTWAQLAELARRVGVEPPS
jgi:hydroxycarboxylate dehydrogenase B